MGIAAQSFTLLTVEDSEDVVPELVRRHSQVHNSIGGNEEGNRQEPYEILLSDARDAGEHAYEQEV